MPKDMSVEELAEDLKKTQAEAIDKVKAIAEEALGKSSAGEKLLSDLKETADEAMTLVNQLTPKITELEQKAARSGSGNNPEEAKSIGEMFVDEESVKAWLDSDPNTGKAELRTKATITTSTTDAAGSVGEATDRTRQPGLIYQPERRLFVRDLLMPGQMDEASIQWIQETGFSNAAEVVAEGSLKPESDIQLTDKTSNASVIAHFMKVSRQALSDVPQLRSHIDGRLLYGLRLKEENQILNGDGTGQNLDGIINQATAFAAPGGLAATQSIDTMRLAMLQAFLAEYPATAHIMNPIDWTRIELTKDGENRYIIGQPQGAISPTLWALPVVSTQSIAVDKFLTGAFNMGAQIWDRWTARVEVGFVNDDFTRNLVTILAEERLALTVYRPEAFIYGDLGFAADS